MTYTVEVEEGKEKDFIDRIKSFGFVKIINSVSEDKKADILDDIKESYTEAVLHSKGKMELQLARDFLNEV